MNQIESQAPAIALMLAQYVNQDILGGAFNVAMDQNLLSDGVVDSLGMLRLVGYIEASYKLKISPDQFTISNFRNIEVISAYVAQLIANAEA